MRKALDALKLTDAEIAERIGVHERTVRRWRQTNRATRPNRRELARLLDSQADRLRTYAEVLRSDT